VKYRGSHHGTNEYPFLIDRDGIAVLPVTSLGLQHAAPADRVSTGVGELDDMLSGRGYYRGSTILVSGTSGTTKTTLAAHFADAACRRGERCLYFLSEESPQQFLRNMRSVGLDLDPWVARDLLTLRADRPSRFGLEEHLATVHRAVRSVRPAAVVIDPITNLLSAGTKSDVHDMLTRIIDYLKVEGITALFTSLTHGPTERQETAAAISSLMDTWVLVTLSEAGGERRRQIAVLKSRGMAHSNRIREFVLTDHGFDLGTRAAEPPGAPANIA
jgi:circadian clock protein KaiC